MTAQPTTRIPAPPFAPQGPNHGAPQFFGPVHPPPFPPAPPPRRGAAPAGPSASPGPPSGSSPPTSAVRLLEVAEVESRVADLVGGDVEVAVVVTCEPAGRTVVVNAPGTPIARTAANTTDPPDSARITVTVSADGTPAHTFA